MPDRVQSTHAVRGFVKRASLGSELAHALEDDRLRIGQVVDDEERMTGLRERDAGMRADVAQAAGDENHVTSRASGSVKELSG